jgi:uncharacterized membrane protein YidH (DUF202 family)
MEQNNLTENTSSHERMHEDSDSTAICNSSEIRKKRWSNSLKVLIDILMVIGFVVCLIALEFFDPKGVGKNATHEDLFSLNSPHCIISLIVIGIMMIHIVQHWNLIKGIIRKKSFLKKKVITITCISFIFTVISISLYLLGFTPFTLHFHGFVVKVFLVVLIVHLINHFKKLLKLFSTQSGKDNCI